MDLELKDLKLNEIILPDGFEQNKLELFIVQQPIADISEAGRHSNPDAAMKFIEAAFDRILDNSQNPSLRFIIFPELSIPYNKVMDVVALLEDSLAASSVAILGIEIISWGEYLELERKLGLSPTDEKHNVDDKLNAALIMIRGDSKCECNKYLQRKIEPSKFESSPYDSESVLPSDYLYVFRSKNLSFLTLICSDFFNYVQGVQRRIIDIVEYEIIRSEGLDFIFNIQLNRSPDHDLFERSLSRIYDHDFCGGMPCTVMANALISDREGANGGGKSRIVFHKDTNLKSVEPVQFRRPPIVGYQINKPVHLCYAKFDRLPRHWSKSTGAHPVKFRLYAYEDGLWSDVESDRKPLLYLSGAEPYVQIDSATYDQLAKQYAANGCAASAVKWGKLAYDYKKNNGKKNYLYLAKDALFVAQQYRHQGLFNKALAYYSEAEVQIREALEFSSTLDDMFVKWRIRAGKIMVEKYLISGDVGKALKEYDSLEQEIKEYKENNPETFVNVSTEYITYGLHLMRQKAEMLRLKSRYKSALSAFKRAGKGYHFSYAEEKAYCVLGEGDTYKMMGEYELAENLYQDAQRFADKSGNERYLARLLRNKAELYRCYDGYKDSVQNLLDRLSKVSFDNSYLFGKIYYQLINGAYLLEQKNIPSAIESFSRALDLTEGDGEVAKLELLHAKLGLADCSRLDGDIEKARDLYCGLIEDYRNTGVIWGCLRAKIGSAWVSERDVSLTKAEKVYIDYELRSILERGAMRSSQNNLVLIRNIP